MKTDLEIAQAQLELALNEIKSIKGRNVELLYDYVFEAHRLVKKLTIPHVIKSVCPDCNGLTAKQGTDGIFRPCHCQSKTVL